MDKKRYSIMGTYVDCLTFAQSMEIINDIIMAKKPTQHVVVNAGKIVSLQTNRKLRDIINGCSIINADGQSVVWASRILKRPIPERVTGIDLMYGILDLASKNGYRVYFLGARPDVIKTTIENCHKTYPNLQIAGFRDGYWTEDEEPSVVSRIYESKADILFLGISSPKKEYWLSTHLNDLGVPLCMGVGGSFDIVAGLTKRAPKLMQKMGLEWLYRLMQEPRRMWKRYLIGNTKFISLVFKYKWIDLRGLNDDI